MQISPETVLTRTGSRAGITDTADEDKGWNTSSYVPLMTQIYEPSPEINMSWAVHELLGVYRCFAHNYGCPGIVPTPLSS